MVLSGGEVDICNKEKEFFFLISPPKFETKMTQTPMIRFSPERFTLILKWLKYKADNHSARKTASKYNWIHTITARNSVSDFLEVRDFLVAATANTNELSYFISQIKTIIG